MIPNKIDAITRPTVTRLGTVLFPFNATGGQHVIAEFSMAQLDSLIGELSECRLMIRRQAQQGAAILDINRHESVV